MEAYQERVVAEKKELDERHSKLKAFLETSVFCALPSQERQLLREQAEVMRQYSDILTRRIESWNVT